MAVTGDMKVSALLKKYPQLLPVLSSYHKHFKKLENPILRRLMAPRVTLSQAAAIAGVDAATLVRELNRAIGVETEAVPVQQETERPQGQASPAWLNQLAPEHLLEVDVRDDLRGGGDPLKKIMSALSSLSRGQVLVVRNIFEPIPLYKVMEEKGLSHYTERIGEEEWKVYFYNEEARGREAD